MSPADSRIVDEVIVPLLNVHPGAEEKLFEWLRAKYELNGGVELLTAAEFAVRTKFHPDTVARWAREKRIPAAKQVGRKWRIPEDAEVLPVNNVQSRKPSATITKPRKTSSSDVEAVQAMLDQARKTRAAQETSRKGGKT
jgi:excisionase family DNA binding protein